MEIKSESIKHIAAALINFNIKVDKIVKDSANPFFKSKYASLSHIQESISIPLAESGLSYSQIPNGENGLITILMHADSGEYLISNYEMKPVKDDPQGRGSAITYQRRYALAAILGLNIDDDDDGNMATHGKSTPDAVDAKPWLNEGTDAHKKAIEALKNKTVTVAQIKGKYRLTRKMETDLAYIYEHGK